MTRFSAGDLQNMSQPQALRLINDAMGRLEKAESMLLELMERVRLLEKHRDK
jgi:hypothetical protein